jgi:hypothetical protein
MSTRWLNRRGFLTLPLALLFGPWAVAWGELQKRRSSYTADVGILYDLLTFRVLGAVEEYVDRVVGRYDVTIAGQGTKIANRIESQGRLVHGRWAPVHSTATFKVAGRESRSEVAYDWEGRVIEYHARAETFLRRRRRAVDDTIAIPLGQHVDDALSAMLNYADGRWPAGPDGGLHTVVVRRRRAETEGPDDVESSYRVELVPFVLTVGTDSAGVSTAHIDMTRFSSWARADQPARVVFGPSRRPSLIASSLILGTSVAIRFSDA